MNQTTQLKIKIARARYNLMFMIILSVINVLFLSSGNAVMMPFSSAISTYATAIGLKAAQDNNNDTYRIIGLVIACTVIFIFAICHLLSKRKSAYLFVAFSILIADTLALLTMSIFSGGIGNVMVLLDLLLHILTLIYVFGGIKAYVLLQKLPPVEENVTPQSDFQLQDIPTEYDDEYNDEDDDAEYDADDTADPDELTQPISKFEDKDAPRIVEGKHKGLEVFVVFKDNMAELVINGYVCDALEVDNLDEYTLRAIVNDIDFVFEYKRSPYGEAMYIYADDELLDSLGRY